MMNMNTINPVNKYEKDCCGCGLCLNICPVSAISIDVDKDGYTYPSIDESKCIKCNKCRSLCVMNTTHDYSLPIKTYAGVRENKKKLLKSSSGGIFAAVAERILFENGFVCGAKIEKDFSIKHTIVNSIGDLEPLLGSKYVQSDISAIFKPIDELLKNKKMVLFCGTPCQVDAIKKYTGNPENLITMEVICHGVPNQKMFKSYVKFLSKNSIKEFIFRDKTQGWSFNHQVQFENGKKKRINHRLSSYMTFFMSGALYRESCFSCPYAKDTRNADITIGDYWGVIRRCPELAKNFDIDKGVSCVIVNSNKGDMILKNSKIKLFESNYNDIKDGNTPLNHPSNKPDNREIILEIWRKSDSWNLMDSYWKKRYYKPYFKAWSLLPNWGRQVVRILLKVR